MQVTLAGVALVAIVAGCMSEAAGSQVWGLNESDRDVVVASSVHGGSLIVPARSWSKIFDAYRDPGGDILVYDEDCRRVATLPLTTPLATVRIDPAGEAELVGEIVSIPTGVVRDPVAAGQTFEPKDCS